MKKNRDRKRFVMKGRAVAIAQSPILMKVLRDNVKEKIRAYGVCEVPLAEFGVSPETVARIAGDLNLVVAYEGGKAILSPSN
jgi:hypothetical protein